MSRRPARSPGRREQYRGINATPRDLLIFSCNPQACELPGLDEALSTAFASLKGVPSQKRFLAAVDGRGFELRWLRQELQQPPADPASGEKLTAAEACRLLRRSHTTVDDKAPLLLLQAQLVRCALRGTWAAGEGATIAAATARDLAV